MKISKNPLAAALPIVIMALLLLVPVLYGQHNGSIWIASSPGEGSGVSEFQIGDQIYLSGSGLAPGTYPWEILGAAGESSCDDGSTIASGEITVDASGSFCFPAYKIDGDHCGTYHCKCGGWDHLFKIFGFCIAKIGGIDLSASWDETTSWEIEKSAKPDAVDLFKGDAAEIAYTVAVDKTVVTSDAVISGTAHLKVIGFCAPHHKLTLLLKLDGQVVDQQQLDLEMLKCDYEFSFTLANPVEGEYEVEAVVNGSGCSGDQASESIDLVKNIIGYPLINVTDGDHKWQFDADDSESYVTTLTCDADEGDNVNTAVITETKQEATAEVAVTCHELEVTKDAEPGYTRTYSWKIDKTGDKSKVQVDIQLPLDPKVKLETVVNYEVAVDVAKYVDSDWAAAGEITIANPAPIDAVIESIADVIPGIAGIDLTCDVKLPYTLAAGKELVCTWSAKLPDAAKRVNTATATLVNHLYGIQGITETGTTDFSGSANITFGAPTKLVDACVTVADVPYGALGELCYGDAPKIYKYKLAWGPWTEADCGKEYTKTNTATLTTKDTKTKLSDKWDVLIKISCLKPLPKPLGLEADCIDPYVYTPTIRVHFIVTNPNSWPIEVPHGIGNAIEPAKYQGEQPTLFAPGETEWEIEIGKYEEISWNLQGAVAKANRKTDICTYAGKDDVYIAGIGVFYDTNHNGKYETGETLLAPDFEGNIGEVYLIDAEGKTVDSRVLKPELFFRAGRPVNWCMRQIWGEYYIVVQLHVPLPAGYRIYPNYRIIHSPEFPEPFYTLENDFGLVPTDWVPVLPEVSLDLPVLPVLAPYLLAPVAPKVAAGTVATLTSVEPEQTVIPTAYGLQQNYPNPFNPQTTISYDLPEQTHVTLTVYDVSGKIITRLVDGMQEAGSYTQIWNAVSCPSGLYFYELTTGSFHQLKRMLLVK